MAALAEARDWLTIFQLPPYAHALHPVEPVWSHLKRSLANLAGSRPPWQSSTRLQRKDAEQEERGGGHRSTKKRRPPNVSCRKTAAARSAEYLSVEVPSGRSLPGRRSPASGHLVGPKGMASPDGEADAPGEGRELGGHWMSAWVGVARDKLAGLQRASADPWAAARSVACGQLDDGGDLVDKDSADGDMGGPRLATGQAPTWRSSVAAPDDDDGHGREQDGCGDQPAGLDGLEREIPAGYPARGSSVHQVEVCQDL
jgi:hypothetical protein